MTHELRVLDGAVAKRLRQSHVGVGIGRLETLRSLKDLLERIVVVLAGDIDHQAARTALDDGQLRQPFVLVLRTRVHDRCGLDLRRDVGDALALRGCGRRRGTRGPVTLEPTPASPKELNYIGMYVCM